MLLSSGPDILTCNPSWADDDHDDGEAAAADDDDHYDHYGEDDRHYDSFAVPGPDELRCNVTHQAVQMRRKLRLKVCLASIGCSLIHVNLFHFLPWGSPDFSSS